jgi:tetratricopeptide (TPR) repeat protein
MVALVELSRAEALIATGRLQDAEAGCERALRLADERGDRLRRAEALRLRAAIARRRARLDEAERLVEEAQQLARESEDALLTAELLRELGEVWQQRGDSTRARAAWLEALTTFRRLGAAPDAGDVEQRLSKLAA